MADSMPPCRIALCDDVESFRSILALLMNHEPDMEIVGQAENGKEAIELVSSQEVDLLLLDIAMPVMDGLEALPLIRRASPQTRVVILTGFGTPEIRKEALAGGAVRVIEKGLDPDQLIELVREARAA